MCLTKEQISYLAGVKERNNEVMWEKQEYGDYTHTYLITKEHLLMKHQKQEISSTTLNIPHSVSSFESLKMLSLLHGIVPIGHTSAT